MDVREKQSNKELLKHHERIIECAWDKAGWKFERVREDKSFPNSYTTATSELAAGGVHGSLWDQTFLHVVGVCNTIRQPVTKEWLYEVIEKYGWKPAVIAPPHHGEKRAHDVANDDSMMPPPKKVPKPS